MPERVRAWAVVPAGGSGSRFSTEGEDKLLAGLAGQPVLVRTIEALVKVHGVEGVVLAAAAPRLSTYQTLLQSRFPHVAIRLVPGGKERRDSVFNGLSAVPEDVAIVAIHDAARPLVRPAVIETALQRVAEGAAGAVVSVPMVDTVKRVDETGMVISETLDRRCLWRAQTPQVFQKNLIMQAHGQVPAESPVTDDAQLMELAGIGPVVVVPGDDSNRKITTREDLQLAEIFWTQSGL